MLNRISESKLRVAREPIVAGLRSYQELSDGALRFDPERAALLTPTPNKTTAARSMTDVLHRGHKVGNLVTVVFYPDNATGSEQGGHKLEDLQVRGYSARAKLVPRDKEGIHSEVHLAIAKISDAGMAYRFGGRLDLLGIDEDTIMRIGVLGHKVGSSALHAKPVATYTVGSRLSASGQPERFGDPHAVFNPNRYTQIGAFLAVPDNITDVPKDVLNYLRPQYPDDYTPPEL